MVGGLGDVALLNREEKYKYKRSKYREKEQINLWFNEKFKTFRLRGSKVELWPLQFLKFFPFRDEFDYIMLFWTLVCYS